MPSPRRDEKKAEQVAGDHVATSEQTLANNSRLVVIDQGGGPYRVLYVSGRPNWEFKFLRRALEEDDQLELAGLVRIARRQPKFDFRNPRTQSTSPLFDGFDHPDAETAERSDQPVLIRLGNKLDGVELRDGFPKTADELYRYHAIVLDDLEAGFFTPDQLALLRNFVSQRGGGLLMLGGPDSFASGKYDRTPVGELLPVYLNRSEPAQDEQEYRLVLTREGWLQPWVRLRKTEDEEGQRLAAMTPFHTLSRVGGIKPGAVVLAEVTDDAGAKAPALVAQQFGKGHVGALLIGRLWRWGMHRENATESDLDRSWRQTVRWLVGDVPGRVEVSTRAKPDSSAPAVELAVRVRDAEYRPLDNAKVALKVTLPGGDNLTLDAEPDAREAGMYSATYVPKQQGAYRVLATATAPDGSAVGAREAGWAAQPAADEFARLQPDREFLKTIASKTHGEIVDGENLDSFVASLSSRSAPDHRAVDVAIVAPPPLFPDRDRLPGRRMGPAPGQWPGVTERRKATDLDRPPFRFTALGKGRTDEGLARVISLPGGGRRRGSAVRRHVVGAPGTPEYASAIPSIGRSLAGRRREGRRRVDPDRPVGPGRRDRSRSTEVDPDENGQGGGRAALDRADRTWHL